MSSRRWAVLGAWGISESTIRFLIYDHDAKFTASFDHISVFEGAYPMPGTQSKRGRRTPGARGL